jgi:hypothetical protein
MKARTASCRCGALKATASGEPQWISVCHCLTCKTRTGSAFSWNAHYEEAKVESEGEASSWTRASDDGDRWCTYHFCPACGSTAWYRIQLRPGIVTIPAGNFADADFGEPNYSSYSESQCLWVRLETQEPIKER